MKQLPFIAKLTGTVNNQNISVTGAGRIDPAIGVTDGIYEFSVPDGFDPMLLSAFLICGYPHATASIEGAPNIFRDKSYEYRRVLTIRDGGQLTQMATVSLSEDGIHSHFHLTGWIPKISELIGIEPVVESWEPNGPGGLRGHFVIAWKTESGRLVTGDAVSSYQIGTDSEQKGLLHRLIFMRTLIDPKNPKLREIQTEGLFASLPMKLWIPDDSLRREFEKGFTASIPPGGFDVVK
jgi:hypothetical protein